MISKCVWIALGLTIFSHSLFKKQNIKQKTVRASEFCHTNTFDGNKMLTGLDTLLCDVYTFSLPDEDGS